MHPASEFSDFRLQWPGTTCVSRSPGCHCFCRERNFLSLVNGAKRKIARQPLRLLLPQHLRLWWESVCGQLSWVGRMNPGTIVVIAYGILAIVGGIIRYVQAQSKASLIHVALNSTHRLDYRSKARSAFLLAVLCSAGIVALWLSFTWGKSSEEAAIKCHTTLETIT